MLSAGEVGKRFGARWIFRGVCIEASTGMRLAITGRNGSGKSTLLKILATLMKPSEGKIEFEGEARTFLGYAALEGNLYEALTVREHLELASALRGCEPRTSELLAEVGLDHASEVAAGALSTGMKGRLRLAIALQAKPKILLLDEPGAGLDPDGRGRLARILDDHCAAGAAIIATNEASERALCSHELELV